MGEFKEEGKVVDVDVQNGASACSPNEQEEYCPAFEAPHWEDSIFLGRQEGSPLLKCIEQGDHTGHNPEGDDGARRPWRRTTTERARSNEECERRGVEKGAKPVQILDPWQDLCVTKRSVARKPEDVDWGGDCSTDEVEVESPLQNCQWMEVEECTLSALTNAKLLYSEKMHRRRQGQEWHLSPRI